MQYTQSPTLKLISSSFLIAGMVTLIVAGKQAMYAQEIQNLSGGGAHTLLLSKGSMDSHVGGMAFEMPKQLHGAASYSATPLEPETRTFVQMSVGILLILIGFCIHALLVMGDERTVRVHGASVQNSKNQKPCLSGRQAKTKKQRSQFLEMYWVEVNRFED